MNRQRSWLMALASLSLCGAASAGDLSGLQKTLLEDRQTGALWPGLYDGGIRAGSPGGAVFAGEIHARAAAVSPAAASSARTEKVPPSPESGGGASERGLWAGIKHGSSQGALGGFFGVLYPAVSLMSKGMDKGYARDLDGYRAYMAAGVVLGAILYVPALVVGAVGGLLGAVAGGVAETAKPGSTSRWDAEKMFDR